MEAFLAKIVDSWGSPSVPDGVKQLVMMVATGAVVVKLCMHGIDGELSIFGCPPGEGGIGMIKTNVNVGDISCQKFWE